MLTSKSGKGNRGSQAGRLDHVALKTEGVHEISFSMDVRIYGEGGGVKFKKCQSHPSNKLWTPSSLEREVKSRFH